MSSSKRRASQLEDNTSDSDAAGVMKVGETNPVENPPEPSQMPSSGPPFPGSSQEHMSQAPLSSQNLQDFVSSQKQASSESNITHKSEKSLAMYSSTELSGWRRFNDPSELTDLYEWSESSKTRLAVQFELECKFDEVKSFSQFLVNTAQSELTKARNTLTAEQRKLVQWRSLPLEDVVDTDHTLCDNLVVAWLEIRKKGAGISPQSRDTYADTLSRLLPTTRRPARGFASVQESAFQQPEIETADGQRTSSGVLQKILEYCRSYDFQRHLAPYTSLVGPSGIGKSFAVSQVAITHGVYVLYLNLGPAGYQGYPKRSAIADHIPSYEDLGEREARDHLTFFWECVIVVGLVHAATLRKLGIPPGAFFLLQSMPTYSSFQDEFATIVVTLYKRIRNKEGSARKARRTEELKSLARKLEKSLTEWARALKDNNDFSEQQTVADWPEILFCIDEGRALLDSSGSQRFRAWREALRRRFYQHGKKTSASVTSENGRGSCFGVILDTSSKIVDFSPPARYDPSQKILLAAEETTTRELFAPIYAIETMDVCANPIERTFPDGSLAAMSHLCNFGRPLWGSRLKNDDDLQNVLSLAKQKINGRKDSQRLALLSYRLNFYVNSHSLAEDLVSNWLRYIVYINQSRDVMRTTQPSEPILAHTAALLMSNADVRLAVLQQFVRSSFEGSINSGDLGEMVSTIVLMFAFDEILFQMAGDAWPMAVPLAKFMNSLFGPEACSSLHECARTDETMNSIWGTGFIFFNHFQRLHNPPTEDTLRTAFDRGCGLLLPINFPGIDIILPIHYAKDSMSFVAISVKNRKNDSWTQGLRNETTTSFVKAECELKLSLPFIGLTMALRGIESKFELLHPKASSSLGLRSRKKPKIDAHSSSSTSATPAATGPEPDEKQYNWLSQKGQKFVSVLALGLDEHLYPAINKCRGAKSDKSQAIPRQLRELLDCNAGVSLPRDANERYVSKLRAIEWKPEQERSGGQEMEF